MQQQAALMACGQTMATTYMNPMTAALSAAQVQQMNAVAAANGFTAGTTPMTPTASDFACKNIPSNCTLILPFGDYTASCMYYQYCPCILYTYRLSKQLKQLQEKI